MARKFLTELAVDASLILPGAAPSTPAAGHIYRLGNTLLYRDSAAGERLLLNAADNLANLTNPSTARNNLGLTAMATATPGGGLSVSSGNLLLTDTIKLRISNTGETATAANNHTEVTVDRACTVVGAKWELAPTATGSSASNAMLYARRSGTKTSLLSANASIASGAVVTDATGTLTGTLTLAANDTVGVDLVSVGTGSSGHIFTILVRYS
jgi:hypothetical protein